MPIWTSYPVALAPAVHVIVRVLPLRDQLRFDAAPGLHELLGGGAVTGGAAGGGVGAVGEDSGSSLAQAPASTASRTIDGNPIRITAIPNGRGATRVPDTGRAAAGNAVEAGLTISNCTHEFCRGAYRGGPSV